MQRLPLRGSFYSVVTVTALAMTGCDGAGTHLPAAHYPDLAPRSQPTTRASVLLDRSQVRPMYSQLLPIDLPTVVGVALAENLDIQQARQRVEASRGELESSVGDAFPVFSPTALFEAVDGHVRATQGNLVGVNFNTFQPYALVQWLLNPGGIYYDVIAARKRLLASRYQERAVRQVTLHLALTQYYDLALAQSRIAVANQAVTEAQELLRITTSRVRAAQALAADEARARAELASRQHDLILAVKSFYDASVELSLTLRLEPTVTLVPAANRLEQATLVRPDLPIEDLLALALEHRDDLASVRTLIAAAAADRKSIAWGGFGPQFQAAGQVGGISGHAQNIDGSNQSFGMHSQERFSASAGWKLGLSSFGEMRIARAVERQAFLSGEQKLDRAKAEVVRSAQDSRTQADLVENARQQLEYAEESLRLSRANFNAGTMTLLDVLHAESTLA
ncbi:MAG TPA: TolC family protein, partial [Lysobacter sp.]|nr:TolC family protein [Lysobacter sp.]